MRSPRLAASVLAAIAVGAAVSPAARADVPVLQASSGEAIAVIADVMARLFIVGLFINDAEEQSRRPVAEPTSAALAAREDDGQYDDWDRPRRGNRRTRDARTGVLFSFGIGGGSMLVSPEGRSGALQGNLRLGYGFSDRFQMFMDLTGAGSSYYDGSSAQSWLFTLRGQTVLIGDRKGNGLNLNLGIGLGGLTRSIDGYDSSSSQAGLALAGGISWDFRITRSFALSPEFFVWWHAVPNGRYRDADVASAYGVQLNFLWYGP